jgi:RNA 2',3'-cyclic 3'-phosphodiesterase
VGATAAATTARLFVALWPDAAVRAAIAAWRDACTWPAGAAAVATPKLHMTLHFIGDVAADRLPAIVQGLRVPRQRFELVLDQCALWPRGLVVLQPSETPAALLALHAACADALRALELPVERRPFRAHVTLARGAAGAALQQATKPLRWPAGELALVRSHPGPRGYEVLSRIGQGLFNPPADPGPATTQNLPARRPRRC